MSYCKAHCKQQRDGSMALDLGARSDRLYCKPLLTRRTQAGDSLVCLAADIKPWRSAMV
jgi:hypothetical protein